MRIEWIEIQYTIEYRITDNNGLFVYLSNNDWHNAQETWPINQHQNHNLNSSIKQNYHISILSFNCLCVFQSILFCFSNFKMMQKFCWVIWFYWIKMEWNIPLPSKLIAKFRFVLCRFSPHFFISAFLSGVCIQNLHIN